jgi:hypothetical protein
MHATLGTFGVLVRTAGLEPAPGIPEQILSLLRTCHAGKQGYTPLTPKILNMRVFRTWPSSWTHMLKHGTTALCGA